MRLCRAADPLSSFIVEAEPGRSGHVSPHQGDSLFFSKASVKRDPLRLPGISGCFVSWSGWRQPRLFIPPPLSGRVSSSVHELLTSSMTMWAGEGGSAFSRFHVAETELSEDILTIIVT